MFDYYPEGIIEFGMQDAWKKAPVSLEICWVMKAWKNKGWDMDYIIDQSLKWHISSFNAKSSAVRRNGNPMSTAGSIAWAIASCCESSPTPQKCNPANLSTSPPGGKTSASLRPIAASASPSA